ncbi:MAG: ATP-binding cassette domain-containing protein [Gammaproteobacteria bacterium]|nr:ATP-binding cassette domain-containing protein [Gammaproteobacteria bacterium]
MPVKLLEVKGLLKSFKDRAHWLNRGKDVTIGPVSFHLNKGETLAIVGAAGSGKSTVAKLLATAETADAGELIFDGETVDWRNSSFFTQNIRIIFQDALKSLNPAVKIGEQLEQVLLFNTRLDYQQRQEKILEALRMVGLLPEHAEYYPHMFSGGQAQRIGIARALILDPKVVIIDEALAPLDPSLRAQVVNLLLDLQHQRGLTFVLISHQISLIKYLSDRVLVMDSGQIVEHGNIEEIFAQPKHPVTKKLLFALDM